MSAVNGCTRSLGGYGNPGRRSRTQRRRYEVISHDEMVDRLLQCARQDASDARDAVSRRPRQKRARADGTQSLILPSSLFCGAVRSSPIGRKMTHTLIWRQARTKRFVTIFGAKSKPPGIWNSAHTHAHMPASKRRMPRAECCCCCRCWDKNPNL